MSTSQSLVLTSERGGLRLFHNNYFYTMLRINERSIRWRCSSSSSKACYGKISTNVTEPYTEFFDMVPHNHGMIQKNLKSLMLRDEILRKAVNSQSTPKKIIKEVLENVDLEVACELARKRDLARVIRNVRKRAREKPNVLDSITTARKSKRKKKKKSKNDEIAFEGEEYEINNFSALGSPSTAFNCHSFSSELAARLEGKDGIGEDDYYEPAVDMMESEFVDLVNQDEETSADSRPMDKEFVKNIVNTYKSKCKPSFTAARLMDMEGDHYSVVAWCTQKNWSAERIANVEQSFLAKKSLTTPAICYAIHDVSNEKLIAYSDTGVKVVIREFAGKDKKYILEIWSRSHLQQTVDLSKQAKLFGEVYANSAKTLRWSPDEDCVMFLAEMKRPKAKSFLDILDSSTDDEGIGHKYDYIDSFGEQLTDVHKPVIVTYNIVDDAFDVLGGLPDDMSPFDVIWTPNGDGVIGVGVKVGSSRLGLVYCTNRPSVIFHLSLDGKFTIISSSKVACNNPRISPNGKYLVWLQRPANGPHHSCHQLVKFNWEEYRKQGKPPAGAANGQIVVDVVEDSILTANGVEFYGLYCAGLAERCFTSDSELFLSTPQRFKTTTYRVELENGIIEEIEMDGDCNVLDVFDGTVVCSVSKLNQPSKLFVAKVNTREDIRYQSSGCVSEWIQLSQMPKESEERENNLDVRYYKIVTKKSFDIDGKKTEINGECSVIYFGEMETAPPKSRGLLIVVHGGPHSTSIDAYSANAAFYAQLGFNLVFVNFHGSTGFGQRNVESLLGRIGEIDVDDVEHAVSTILDERTEIDPEKIAVTGGSYGGYLAVALSQRSNINLKAVVTRNPVVDLSSMPMLSDIPDWALVESGFQWRGKFADLFSNKKANKQLRQFSLMDDFFKVKAPTLLMVGTNDRRVPPGGAVAYYKLLKEANVPTKLFVYDDCHPLSTFNADLDSSINSALWLSKYVLRCDS